MSKKAKPNGKQFKYELSRVSPKAPTIKLEWDLVGLYYKSEHDPQIEKDIVATEKAYAAFAKKYKNKDFTSSSKKLLAALKDSDALLDLVGHKPAYYYSYRRELDSTDEAAEKALNLLEQRLTKIGNEVIFFDIAIGKIPKAQQKLYLKDPALVAFHFYLQGIFESAKYTLSEPEERILSLKSLTSRSMWVSGTEKILNQKFITHKGKDVPIHGALMKYMDLPWTERHQMWDKAAAVLEAVAPIAENELNALVTDKKITDELRGYQKPYSSTVLAYDHTEKSVEALREAITTTGYKITHDFYQVKQKWVGKPLSFIDRDESVGEIASVPYETSVAICRDAFYEFNPIYGEIFDEMLASGQIDVYPKQGKGGGAFCSSGTNVPTVVFLNHNDGFDGLRTLAHEMGHAIHAYRSKLQPKRYAGHSIATAETASTFFENVVSRKLLELAPTKDKVNILNKLISDNLKTIVMCIARFNIELEYHETIRREGSMNWQTMRDVYQKHMQAYVGKAINVRPSDGLHFVSKPHYRMNFYQYTYSFGNLMSSLMYRNYQADQSYQTAVDTFLTAGEHASVDDIFKSIDINTTKTETYHEGLALLAADIKQFTALVKAKK